MQRLRSWEISPLVRVLLLAAMCGFVSRCRPERWWRLQSRRRCIRKRAQASTIDRSTIYELSIDRESSTLEKTAKRCDFGAQLSTGRNSGHRRLYGRLAGPECAGGAD